MANGRSFHFILVALTAVLLSGCGALMEKPLPATPLSKAERARFEGAWVGVDDKGEHVVDVHVTCDGMAHLGMMGWDKDKFRVANVATWQFSRGARDKPDSGFISMHLLEERGKPDKDMAYIPLKYRFMSDHILVLWLPSQKAVATAIKTGRLKGKADKFANDVTSSPKAMLKYLDSAEGEHLFKYRHPLVLHKVTQAVIGADTQQGCKKKK